MCGVAFGLSLIENSSPRLPSPLKTLGNFFRTISLFEAVLSLFFSVASNLAARCSPVMAGSPNRLVLSPFTSYTF